MKLNPLTELPRTPIVASVIPLCSRAICSSFTAWVNCSALANPCGTEALRRPWLYLFEVHDTVRISPQVSPFAIIPPNATIETGSAGGVLALFRAAASGLTLAFADESYAYGSQGLLDSWAWDFGDSGSSTEQSPSHTYAGAGTYTVTLTVTSSGGSSSTISALVVVA